MPMFPDTHHQGINANFSPLASNMGDMIAATERLHAEMEYIVDDSEAYGVLTEDTFMENCPEILKQMERISALLRSSNESLSFADEMFDTVAPAELMQALFVFLSQHSAILSTLGTHCSAIQRTGPYYDSLSRAVNAQQASMLRFKASLDSRFSDVKVRAAGSWNEMENVLGGVVQVYPMPAGIVVMEE